MRPTILRKPALMAMISVAVATACKQQGSSASGNQTLAAAATAPTETKIADVYFWHQDNAYGDRNLVQVTYDAQVKNSGTSLNRETSGQFTVDAWLFGTQITKSGLTAASDSTGLLVDIAAHLNRGKLSSYSYVRVLGETKFQAQTAEPKFNQTFTRSFDGATSYPIFNAGIGRMDVKGKVTGTIGAVLQMTSPNDTALRGEFSPKVNLSTSAALDATGPFWTSATVKGQLTLLDYALKTAVEASYDAKAEILTSKILVQENRLKAIAGKLTATASFGPDASAQDFAKFLWSEVKGSASKATYSRDILAFTDQVDKDFGTFEQSRRLYIKAPKTIEECVTRTEQLLAEAKGLVESVKRDNNATAIKDASSRVDEVLAMASKCRTMPVAAP